MDVQALERIRFVTRHFNNLQGLRFGVPLGLILLGLGRPVVLQAALFLGALLLMLGARRYYRNTFGEVEPERDGAAPVSVLSPVGPAWSFERPDRGPVTPMARHLLVTMTLAVLLFSFLQGLRPHILVRGNESLGQQPQVVSELASPPGPPGVAGYRACSMRTPTTMRAVFAQWMYLLSGAFFLGVWLWRERREPQSHSLILAVLLLGLAALGTSLGFHVPAAITGIINFVLPALVNPGIAQLLCGASLVLAGLFDHWQLARALGPLALQEES